MLTQHRGTGACRDGYVKGSELREAPPQKDALRTLGQLSYIYVFTYCVRAAQSLCSCRGAPLVPIETMSSNSTSSIPLDLPPIPSLDNTFGAVLIGTFLGLV